MMDRSRRKTYLVLLGVSALGLVLDRYVFTQSATAPAQVSAGTGAERGAGAGTPTTDTGPSASIPEIPFPQGLETAVDHLPILDLFAPPDVRLRGESGAGRTHKGAGRHGGRGGSERLNGAAFERRHTLDGVLVYQRLRMAVLDGRPVKIGESIDGCTLKDVSGYRARFECRDGLAVLIVKDTGAGAPG